jgi:putative glutamine amidotransferase
VSRPTIGITASLETVTSGSWVEDSAVVPVHYVQAVHRAGGRAVLLVPDAADAADPADVLEQVDGVVVSGAAGDVDPRHYGARRESHTRPVAPVRDDFELALVRAAGERGVPLLGICRGMQVLNVAHGGSLVQHLPAVLGHDRHAAEPGVFVSHEVRLEPGSLAARAVGAERTEVRGYHHQGVRELGDGLRPTGWSALEDGIVEAVEGEKRPFLLGVLWHPEEDEASRVIGALVEEAENRKDRRN